MSSAQDLPPTAETALPARTRSRAALQVVPELEPEIDLAIDLRDGAKVDVVWDESEFEAVLRRATPRLVRFAQRRLGNLHEAEEVAQEALLRTYQHRHTLATENDIMAWATFASNRLVIDRLRVRGRSISVAELPEGRRVARDTAEIAEARAEARLALDALDALPARQAAVLWAREVEGSSYEDISERFGLTEPTVRSLLHRARKALRREYASRGGTMFAGIAILGPWLNPLNHARKLRAIAAATLTTTALGVVGLGVLGTSVAPNHDLSISPQTSQTRTSAVESSTALHGLGARVAKAKGATGNALAPSSAHIYTYPGPLQLKACGAKGAGFNCSTPQKSKVIYLGPTDHRLYIGTDAISCDAFNAIPAASPLLPSIAGCDQAPPQGKSAR